MNPPDAHSSMNLPMDDEVKRRTQETAGKLFGPGIKMDPPYRLRKEFDKNMANDLSVFITGNLCP